MAILNFQMEYSGQSAIYPRRGILQCNDTYGQITTAGYINNASGNSLIGTPLQSDDIIFCSYGTNASLSAMFSPSIANGIVTLIPYTGFLKQYASGTFTLAQLQGAYTTPIQLITAPGSGFMVLIDQFQLELIYGSAAFSGGGVAYLQYGATAHGINFATPVTGSTIPATLFTGLNANIIISVPGTINATAGIVTSVTNNAAITYTNATAVFTSGTGGSGTWSAIYSIIPIV